MIKTLGVVHFTIQVMDLERSAKFYNELLGMRILYKTPQMVFLKCGYDYLILGKCKTPIHSNAEGDTSIQHAFKVAGEDYDRSLEFLKQNGDVLDDIVGRVTDFTDRFFRVEMRDLTASFKDLARVTFDRATHWNDPETLAQMRAILER
ncbi:MAG: VOC family protein, partial [Candidatus Binatia bacterium]